MRIGIIASLYYPYTMGGAEKSTQELAEGLVKLGNQVFILTHKVNKDLEQENINGVQVTRIQPQNFYSPHHRSRSIILIALWHLLDSFNPFAARKVSMWIKENQLDLVNSQNISGFSPLLWKIASQMGIPVVHSVRDLYVLCPRTTMYRGGNMCVSQCIECLILSKTRLQLSNYVNVLVGASEFVLNHHMKYNAFPKAVRKLIRIGTPSDITMSGSKMDKHGQENRIRFGYIGRIEEEKGINWLIESYLMLEGHDIELFIAGRGESEVVDRLKELTAERSDIVWLGYIEPAHFFRGIDVLIVPSLWHDTSPRVINEAFLNGVPVIGSTRGGIPEFISEEDGWLVDPSYKADLIIKIEHVIQNKERLTTMGEAAREKVELLSVESTINQYQEVYRSFV